MFIAHRIGGMTLGEGDMLRRYMDKASPAIKKKNAGETLTNKEKANYAEFEKYWNKFLEGAAKQGYNTNDVDKIKDYIVKYIGYSFNKSHAAAYSYLAMRTLFLKHYYTTEFYTALFNHPKTFNDKDKTKAWLTSAIAAAMIQGIVIKPPSLKSGWHWTMTGDKEISMGFSAINGVGDIAHQELQDLLLSRNKKLETITMAEFFELPFSKFNKTSFGSCVKAGVFDSWSDSRQYLLSLKEKKKRKKVDAKQIFMFDMGGEEFNLTNQSHDFPKTTEEEKRASFLEVCSFDLEKIKRIAEIKEKIKSISKKPIENIVEFENDGWYYFLLESISESTTKNGAKYLILKIGDGITNQNLRVFSPMCDQIKPILNPGCIYATKFEKNQNGFINIIKGTKLTKVDI
jgi:DNA polymerase-3 subunit alpha